MTHFIHTAHQCGTAAVSEGDWLEVRRGMTQFPRRPLVSNRFLIGSGTNCHLQLGGGMPMLHTLLTREHEGWVAEAMVAEPPLFVNDDACRRQALCFDDVLRIGTIELVLRRDPDGAEDRDGSRESWASVTLDHILRAGEHANTEALVLHRESDESPAQRGDVHFVPQAHPLRRAVDRHDAALRLLASQDANADSQSRGPHHTAPRPQNRVA